MDLRWIMILGFIGFGAYKLASGAKKNDEDTAAARAQLLAWGLPVQNLTPAEIRLVWQFKQNEAMGNWQANDQLQDAIKAIIAKYRKDGLVI
jgi:hypothetical protein